MARQTNFFHTFLLIFIWVYGKWQKIYLTLTENTRGTTNLPVTLFDLLQENKFVRSRPDSIIINNNKYKKLCSGLVLAER